MEGQIMANHDPSTEDISRFRQLGGLIESAAQQNSVPRWLVYAWI
jgi:hypothetical protein